MATPKAATASATAPAAAATKTTKTPMTDEQKAANKVARESTLSKDKFVRVFGTDGKGFAPAKALPPQAQCICNVIEAAGKGGLTRDELVKNLKGVLVTKQPEGRILSYYQKLIQDSGCVKITLNQPEVAPAK